MYFRITLVNTGGIDYDKQAEIFGSPACVSHLKCSCCTLRCCLPVLRHFLFENLLFRGSTHSRCWLSHFVFLDTTLCCFDILPFNHVRSIYSDHGRWAAGFCISLTSRLACAPVREPCATKASSACSWRPLCALCALGGRRCARLGKSDVCHVRWMRNQANAHIL